MKKIHNLKLFGLVAILTVVLVFIGVDFIESQVKTQDKSEPGKPNKPPDKPGKPDTEWIEFRGDLNGAQEVIGCCPNAGPWPPYTMTLTFGSNNEEAFFPPGTYLGQLFINAYGAGRNQKYKVQFWWDYENDLGIEIIGGVLERDRKNKVSMVIFTDDECRHINSDTFITLVNFTLERYTLRF